MMHFSKCLFFVFFAFIFLLVECQETDQWHIKYEHLSGKFDTLLERINRMEQQNQNEIKALNGKINILEDQLKSFRRPSEIGANFEDGVVDYSYHKRDNLSRAYIPRTCLELSSLDPRPQPSGMYWIDPDGVGIGEPPIYVYCDMTSNSTIIGHDAESELDVDLCFDPGCFKRTINYTSSSIKQIVALIELSSECHQSIRYQCRSAPLEFNQVNQSWWNDRKGDPQYFWTGDNSSIHICQCGLEGNCQDSSVKCNCDALLPSLLIDEGTITKKSSLPITSVQFGRTAYGSKGTYNLGQLVCSGKIEVQGMPETCTDLWRIGHLRSGIYLVQGSDPQNAQVGTVYCNMSKSVSDPGFQHWLGINDIKTTPVYFYVQRHSSFSSSQLSFETQLSNVGGAMDIESGTFTAPVSGNYFFSLSGIGSSDDKKPFNIGLHLNNVLVSTAHSEQSKGTFTLQSTLKLKPGDEVKLFLISGGYIYDDNYRFTHYTGFLMEQDQLY